jgi:putative FmdB family regulatory protein
LIPFARVKGKEEGGWMPIYEYECNSCHSQFQWLVMSREEEHGLVCPQCKGGDLVKLISRVAYHVSEADRLASYDPNQPKGDGFYRDSRNIGLHAKKRAQQLGVDLGGDFEAKLDKLRADPGSVVRDSES